MTPPPDDLISTLERAVLLLLQEVDPSSSKDDTTQPAGDGETDEVPIGFADRVKAIELGIKLVATKNKLDTGDADDEFSRLRRGTIRGAGGRGRAGAAAPRTPAGTA
jgi:hypothetical protein